MFGTPGVLEVLVVIAEAKGDGLAQREEEEEAGDD